MAHEPSARGSTLERLGRAAVGHPARTAFAVALAARVAAVVVLELVPSLTPQLDDVQFAELASGAATGREGWRPTHFNQFQRNATFLLPLSAVYRVFGAMSPAGAVFVAVLGALTAGLVALLAREFMEPAWALAPGLVVALLPSQVYFSSLTLKDAMVWALVSLVAVAVAVAGRVGRTDLVLCLALAATAMVLFTFLRPHTMLLMGWALVPALWVGLRRYRFHRGAAAIALAIGIPWLAGMGPAGADFVLGLDPVSEYRDAQATGNTPIVTPARVSFTPTGRDGERQAPSDAEDDRISRELGHLPRGIFVMLLEPHPFQAAHNAEVRLAKLEMAVWYPLLALAAVGIWAAATAGSAAARVVAFPMIFGLFSLAVSALAEGNFGTAYRHRGEFVWVIALLASLGARHLWLRSRGLDAPPEVTNPCV